MTPELYASLELRIRALEVHYVRYVAATLRCSEDDVVAALAATAAELRQQGYQALLEGLAADDEPE